MLEQGEVLKHKAHLALLNRSGGGLFPGDPNPPRIRLLQAGDQPQQRALAGTGGPEQRHQRAGVDIEADVVDRPKGAELFTDAGNPDAHDDHTSSNSSTLTHNSGSLPAYR